MKLKEICEYISDRVAVIAVSEENYISTENMAQNKGGVTRAASLPSSGAVIRYKNDDILISNIRPYFKKIWQADKNGGCSADVLCIRAKEHIDSTFLYYLLSQDAFFEYVMTGAKGCKMPRGDKSHIMDWDIDIPEDKSEQTAIGQCLKVIDKKIEINKQINDNLEQQAQAAFNNIVANYSECETINLSDIAALNPKRTITKGTLARSIEMAQLPTSGSFPAGWDMKEYNGGMKFQNGDTLMARITPCLENGKVAYINFLEENEVAFGSTEYIVIAPKGAIAPEVFYFLTRHNDFVDFAVKNMNGSSGRQRVSAETIGTYKLPVISPEDMVILETIAKEALTKIKYNSLENIRLSEMRDTLLPKLMSGELKINEIDC